MYDIAGYNNAYSWYAIELSDRDRHLTLSFGAGKTDVMAVTFDGAIAAAVAAAIGAQDAPGIAIADLPERAADAALTDGRIYLRVNASRDLP
ncbi:hypothetical protein CVT25_011745 [Psilocybe cyanescens]|uniref:Uncharacterized protein n=1 Tax=Psilocybe cyanescens TaxID=93625 RepID=A0A409WIC8_PSICY|nr:hypothetical protein CVT25_011745 [Psilocybe cyanescens]